MTADKVPACTEISKTIPKSFASNSKDGNNKCAELETGKNSVNPWISARRSARKKSEIMIFYNQES